MAGGDASADASRRAGSARDSASSSRPPKPFWRWHPSRGRPDERDDDPRWLARRKHFFILSDAGKPVWSRYGDAANLSSFAAAVSAMLASASEQLNSFGSKRDADDQGRAGHDEERVVSFILDESFHNERENKPPNHARVVALTKNGLSFVALSRANESKNVLLRQTRLFRHQLLFVLTSAVEKAVLRSGSKFDPHRLLRDETGGAARALGALAHQCTWDPGAFLGAWAPLPFSSNKRRKTYAALREALGDVKHMRTHGTRNKSGIFFAMVATARHVVALAASPRFDESKSRRRRDSSRAPSHPRDRLPMHPDDVYVLTHFARHVGASRHNDETFAPVCLPRRDPTSFAHAHVTVLSSNRRLAKNDTARDDDDETSETSDAGTFLVLVAEEGGPDAFSAARRCKADIEKTLRLSSSVSGSTGGCVLDAIERRVSRADDDVEKTEPASPSNPSPKIGEEGAAAVLSAGRPLQTVSRLTREEPVVLPRRLDGVDENAHVGEVKEHADDRRDDNKPSLGAPPWRIVTAPEDKKNPRPGDVARGSVRLDREVPRAAGGGDSTRRVLHFLYVRPTLGQYVAPEWSAPLDGRDAQKATLRAYRRVADAVSSSRLADDDGETRDTSALVGSTRHGDRGGGGGGGGHAPFSLASFFQGLGIGNESRNTTHGEKFHSDAAASPASRSYGDYRNGFDYATAKDVRRVHFESSGARVLLGFAGSDFELYVAMAPGTSRTDAVAACNRLCTWLRQEEPRLFAAVA